ncbi:MAG: hypothetical protein R6X15_02250 [Pseudomonadota bacterium]
MDTSVQYRVIFSGRIRNGFERSQVMQNLAQKLRLNTPQLQRLFDGEHKHVLKRTASEEEARRYIMQMARLGAVATLMVGDDTNSSAVQRHSESVDKGNVLPGYAPLKRNFLLRPLLFLAACFESLLALVYAVILLAVATGTLYYSLFTHWASGVIPQPLPALALQVLCAALALVALFLMVKPLLSFPHMRDHGVILPADREPDLHMFVEDLCERLNLPVPVEIRINNDIAISFRHYRGPIGFWKGESILTLGAPLLAAVTTNQLAGLFAQAAYCFRPPLSPRAAFLVLLSNQWLHRAVYGEDVIDRTLARLESAGRLPSAPLKVVTSLFGFSRKVLQRRLAISRGLERALVHRLVADADRRALTLTGSKGFAAMAGQQLLLRHACDELIPKLQQQWLDSGKLPEDLFPLLLRQARAHSADTLRRLYPQQEKRKAKTADIIPSDAQRIRRVQKQSVDPNYGNLSPAKRLLRYFSKIAITMTVRFYHSRMKITVSPDQLLHLPPKDSTEYRVNRRIENFFNNTWSAQVPLQLSALIQSLHSAEEAGAQWRKAATLSKQDYGRSQESYHQFMANEKLLLDNTIKEEMYRAEIWREPGGKKRRKGQLEAFHQHCRDSEQAYDESLLQLRRYIKPYALRLAAALALLKFAPHYSNDGALFKKAQRLINLYHRIESTQTHRHELKLHTALVHVLLNYSRRNNQNVHDLIEEQSSDIRRKLTAIRAVLKDIDNPYPAQHGGKKVMDYLLLESYTEENPRGDYDRGNDVVRRLELLQRRILAQLITIAREAEKSYC